MGLTRIASQSLKPASGKIEGRGNDGANNTSMRAEGGTTYMFTNRRDWKNGEETGREHVGVGPHTPHGTAHGAALLMTVGPSAFPLRC